MTDNEITKALECCVNGEDCLNCPLQEQFADCKPMTGALDLINRQKAEIERLKKAYFWVEEAVIKTAKAEAVKEFAERLKEQMCQENELYKSCAKGLLPKDYQQGYEEKNDNVIRLIDNLIKEWGLVLMYSSPIELITSDFQLKVGKSIDEQIYNAVLNVGVNVDKSELLKALLYDRKQYQKGCVDGMKEFAEKFEAILATYECTFIETQNWSARNTILQVIQDLRNLAKEMAGENNG